VRDCESARLGTSKTEESHPETKFLRTVLNNNSN
jgi:hypothetical protein